MFKSVKQDLIYFISSTDILAVSLIVPLYTQYLKSIEFSNVNVGLLNSLYSGVQFFASPFIGHLSDVHGSRSVLIVSLVICSLCYPVMGTAVSFTAIACVRTAIGVVKHTQLLCKNYIEESTATRASSGNGHRRTASKCNAQTDVDDVIDNVAVATAVVNDQHMHSFGKLSGFMSLGYIVGPIVGGYLIDWPNGFAYMCLATGFLFAINSAFAYCLPDSDFDAIAGASLSSRTGRRPVSRPNFVNSLKNIPWAVCWDLFLLKSLSVFAVFSFYLSFNASVSGRYGVSSVHLGYSFSLQGFVRAVTGFAVHRIFALFPASYDVSRKIRIIYALLAASFAALYYSPNFYAYLVCLVPLNVCLCFIRIANHEALIERVDAYNKGIILGAFNNVTAVCRFVLPLISGYLADKYDHDSAYIISIGSLLAAICLVTYKGRLVRHKIE